MLGHLIALIRKKQRISKASLARDSCIDVGFLAHIEKSERTPSHNSLRKICDCLDLPYQPLMYAYDKSLSKEQLDSEILNHVCYDRIIAVSDIDSLIFCPEGKETASLAIKVNDDLMEPILSSNSYAFVELNSPLNNKEIGLFFYNNKCLFRKLIIRQDGIILRALKKDVADIKVSALDSFYILGKVLINDKM